MASPVARDLVVTRFDWHNSLRSFLRLFERTFLCAKQENLLRICLLLLRLLRAF